MAEETAGNAPRAQFARSALVGGTVGIVVAPRGRMLIAITVTITDEGITEMDVIGEPTRLTQLDLAVLVPQSRSG